MTTAAPTEASPLFPTLHAIVQAGGAVTALRCARDLFPIQHHLETARALRQRAVLMMAQCADLRADRQSARRDISDLNRSESDLNTRTRDYLGEAEGFAKGGGVAPQLLSRVRIIAEQAKSELGAVKSDANMLAAPAAIFISYRRSDSKEITGFIADRLQERFGEKTVFWDIDSIPPGVDFRAYIVSRVSKCKACLVVIGPDWLNAAFDNGRRRIDDDDDLVRVEVETALRLGIPVAPILVREAPMPTPKQLPSSLAPLLARHGMNIRPPPDFDIDIDRLMGRLSDQLG